MPNLLQDLRYGIRMLRKNPGFTLVAVMTLALGIGANTAIFSVVYGVMLKALPYPDPDPIVRVWQAVPSSGFEGLGFSEPQLIRLRANSQSFDQVGGYVIGRGNLATQNEIKRIPVARVSSGVFETLGIQPRIGRAFTTADESPTSQPIAILSSELWQRTFNSDPGVLGQVLTLNDNPFTIVGIMPSGFRLPEDLSIPEATQLWLPLRFNPSNMNTGSYYMQSIARLKPGVTPEQGLAEVSTIFAQIMQDFPEGALTDPGYSIRVLKLHDDLVGDVRRPLWILVGAVAVVLLIACGNVASLLLARSAIRQKEIAVRAALGAGRTRLVRQLLTESVVIALTGGVAGVLLATWSVDLIASSGLVSIPRLNQVGLNIPVLLFTLGVSLISAVIFGMVPAAQLSQFDLNKALREEGRGLTGNVGRNRVHRVLVVSEVALAMILVIAAGLLLRSFDRLLRIDPGFNVENLLTAAVSLTPSRYQDNTRVTAFYGDLLDRVKRLPGVVSAAATSGIPLAGASGDTVFQIEGRAETDLSAPPEISSSGHFYFWQVTPDYFKTMGIALSSGRGLQDADGPTAPLVVVINETMARSFWPTESCLGKRIQLFWTATRKGPWAEIVGVVRDVPIRRLNEEPQPEAYFSSSQGPLVAGWTARGMVLTVRTASDPMLLADAVRREVRDLDSAAPVFSVQTAEEVLDQTVAQRRFNLVLLGVFAAVALVLAAVGIYGILANAVRMRTQEIGIRLALGARSGTVFRQVVGHGMLLAVVGVVIGIGGAFALTRYLEGLLYEVRPTDPITFGGVAAILLSVSLIACFLPARRATKVDPIIALRYE